MSPTRATEPTLRALTNRPPYSTETPHRAASFGAAVNTRKEERVLDELPQIRPAPERPPSDESDLLLIDRIAAGDRDAFRDLYGTYYHRLLRFIYRVTRQHELAQEGVNDVMLVVWRNSGSFGRRSKVSTWIMGIAFRKALKLLDGSRRWRDRFKAVDFGDWNEGDEGTIEPGENRDLRDLLDQGLRQLSPEQRAVVELTYFGGYSHQEIAQITGCPLNTVKTRMFHARAKLRKLLPTLSDELHA
jgi:RNA polymerase sigma-70 factor (ECF subfamily)